MFITDLRSPKVLHRLSAGEQGVARKAKKCEVRVAAEYRFRQIFLTVIERLAKIKKIHWLVYEQWRPHCTANVLQPPDCWKQDCRLKIF